MSLETLPRRVPPRCCPQCGGDLRRVPTALRFTYGTIPAIATECVRGLDGALGWSCGWRMIEVASEEGS